MKLVLKKKSLTGFKWSCEGSNFNHTIYILKIVFLFSSFKTKISLLPMEIKKTQQNKGEEKPCDLLLIF